MNGDGNIDVLSGSYSRMGGGSMAGTFQVLYGDGNGAFNKPKTLNGSDGEPLIIPAGDSEDADIDRICTRPFACDLDGDGKLDIVSGNFAGTFAFFKGDGNGKFSPKASWLQANGETMKVAMHSDPFLIDWDGDGDLDMLSGSAQGGAFLFFNEGDKQNAKFGKRITLLDGQGHGMMAMMGGGEPKFGDAHVDCPASGTRVWAADIDKDGKLDLLVGDQLTLQHLAEGVDEKTGKAKMVEFQKKEQELFETMQNVNFEEMDEEQMKAFEESQQKLMQKYEELRKERSKFVVEDVTGFVWLLKQK